MGPLANGALCLSTPKHDGKSGTDHHSAEIIGHKEDDDDIVFIPIWLQHSRWQIVCTKVRTAWYIFIPFKVN